MELFFCAIETTTRSFQDRNGRPKLALEFTSSEHLVDTGTRQCGSKAHPCTKNHTREKPRKSNRTNKRVMSVNINNREPVCLSGAFRSIVVDDGKRAPSWKIVRSIEPFLPVALCFFSAKNVPQDNFQKWLSGCPVPLLEVILGKKAQSKCF